MFIYIALELCHCDLDSFVSQRENFELQDREIMLQCATGLEHIHSLGYRYEYKVILCFHS